jgi:hypothetical protein
MECSAGVRLSIGNKAVNNQFQASERLSKALKVWFKKESRMRNTTTKIPFEQAWNEGPSSGLIGGMKIENKCSG